MLKAGPSCIEVVMLGKVLACYPEIDCRRCPAGGWGYSPSCSLNEEKAMPTMPSMLQPFRQQRPPPSRCRAGAVNKEQRVLKRGRHRCVCVSFITRMEC